MKQIGLGLLILCAIGCQKDDNRPNLPSWGFFSAHVNGTPWTQTYAGGYGSYSTAIPCQNGHYALASSLYNRSGYLRQTLSFTKIPLQAGKYKVIPFLFECEETDPVYSRLTTISDDGDVLQDRFNVLESEDNYLQIDSYNEQTKQIKGTFQVTYLIERRSANDPSALPDTLRFTNGVFHTRVLENKDYSTYLQ